MDKPEDEVFLEQIFIKDYDQEGRLIQATKTEQVRTYCGDCWREKSSNKN
jgi:hypothetical protein